MVATKLEVVGSADSQNPIFASVRQFAMEGLGDLIRVLMENVDDALFALSDKVGNDQERRMYFEAMREIRLQREGLRQKFTDELRQGFERALNGESLTPGKDDDDDHTLIVLDELEDRIAIGNMVTRARPRFENELFALNERLKQVLQRRTFTENQNPLDPRAICECFHNASELLPIRIQVKLILYKLFERYVIDNLGHFYREVNALFVDKGVLPDLKADQERMQQTTRFMANRISTRSAGSSEEYSDGNRSEKPASHAGVAEPSTTITEAPISSRDLFAALTELQKNAIFNQSAAAADPQSLLSGTQQQLLELRRQNRSQLSKSDNQAIDAVSMLFDFFFDDEVLPAPIKLLIARLQVPVLKVAIIDNEFFNQKKHPARKLLDSISRASPGWGKSPESDRGLIGNIEQVVTFLLVEFDDDIAVFDEALARLENCLQQNNPLTGQTVEEKQQSGQQNDQQFQQARNSVGRVIAKLTENRDLSAEVAGFLEKTWSSVLVKAYLTPGKKANHWHNLKRISAILVWTLVPKNSEQERLRIIKTIPALLRALSKGMDLADIDKEAQNRIIKMLAGEHARIIKLTSNNIVTRVDDRTVSPEDGAAVEVTGVKPIEPAEPPDTQCSGDQTGDITIIDTGEDGDSAEVIDATEESDAIKELYRLAICVNEGRVEIDEEIVMESPDGDNFDLADDVSDHLEQVLAMEVGDWVEITDASSKPVAARLFWKSNETGKLVFVNRQGQKLPNFTTTEFATELRAGRASLVKSSSVLDRALSSIKSKMQSP